MDIAVIGAGEMGGALAVSLSHHHRVSVLGSRPGSHSVLQILRESGGRLTEGSVQKCAEADLTFVAVPWDSVAEVIETLRSAPPTHLVSVVVPWTGDNAVPATDRDSSAAERFRAALPMSHVGNAFTTVSAATIRSIERYQEKPTVFAVSDSSETKSRIAQAAASIGFAAVDAGPLYAARFTEAMGFLWTSIAFEGGAGELAAFRLVLPS